MNRIGIAVAALLLAAPAYAQQVPGAPMSPIGSAVLQDFQAMATAANHVQDGLQRLIAENQRLTAENAALRQVSRQPEMPKP